MVAVNATGCLEVFTTPCPETAWQIPWLHSVFGNALAVATGVAAAMRMRGKTDVRVVAQGGAGWRRVNHRHRLWLPVGHLRTQR